MSKSGMYGELPVIRIGAFTVSDMTEKDSNSIWVMNETTGEGAEFKKEIFLPVLEQFFKENF